MENAALLALIASIDLMFSYFDVVAKHTYAAFCTSSAMAEFWIGFGAGNASTQTNGKIK